jgi:hypothetical protein
LFRKNEYTARLFGPGVVVAEKYLLGKDKREWKAEAMNTTNWLALISFMAGLMAPSAGWTQDQAEGKTLYVAY